MPGMPGWSGGRERRPGRPGYWRALTVPRGGRAGRALTVDLDRTGRHPEDLAGLIGGAGLFGVQVRDLAREADLTPLWAAPGGGQEVAHAEARTAPPGKPRRPRSWKGSTSGPGCTRRGSSPGGGHRRARRC
jgi:hypothetical protein